MSAPPGRILFVGLGTTGGWRHADRTLARALAARGFQVTGAWPELDRVSGADFPLRPLSTELWQSWAMRRTLNRHAALRPQVVITSASTSMLLLPAALRERTIVWSDSPLWANREGRRNAPLRHRERGVLPKVSLFALQTLAFREAVEAHHGLAPGSVFDLPVPVAPSGPPPTARRAAAVIYAGNPHKKGLDLAVAAWTEVKSAAELFVTGIEERAARGFLAQRNVVVPPTVRFLGRLPTAEHRALTRSAAVYLSTSRREEYGNTQLEALIDGALLVSGPTDGSAEPRALACRLAPDLVAPDFAAGLVRSIELGLGFDLGAAAAYRRCAQQLLQAYSPEAFERQVDSLSDHIRRLPAL